MSKVLGYLLSIVGILVLVYTTIAKVKDAVPIPLLNTISPLYGAIIGIALILIGIILLVKGSKPSEIPIYEGDKVVGYRKQ